MFLQISDHLNSEMITILGIQRIGHENRIIQRQLVLGSTAYMHKGELMDWIIWFYITCFGWPLFIRLL